MIQQTIIEVVKRQDPSRPILLKPHAPQKTKPFIKEKYQGPVNSANTIMRTIAPDEANRIVSSVHTVIVQTTDGTSHYPALWIVYQ